MPAAHAVDMDATAMCERYEALYTGLIADMLDERGHPARALGTDVMPIDPTHVVAGLAFPAVGRPHDGVDPEAQMQRFLTMLGEAPTASCLVIAAQADVAAHVGELTTTALAAQGCRGVVTDGGVRDTAAVLAQGFPVFSRYRSPLDSIPRWELEAWDTTVTIDGVPIAPGDVVIGDIDGVVIVPRADAEAVLTRAEEVATTEDAVRAAITDGMSPQAAYDRHGKF